MSIPVTEFASKSTIDPLEDDEFSDLTKQEIAYWSHKLKIRPSQLFSLPKEELERLMENAIRRENNEEPRLRHSESLGKLGERKNKLVDKQRKDRLKGGAGPDLWEILANAAQEIESMYGSSFSQSCDMADYDSVYSDEEESAAEDCTFNVDQNLVSTPCAPQGRRQYCPPNPNATYNISHKSTPQSVRNATYTCPKSSFKLECVTPPPSMRSTKSSSYGSPYRLADITPPSGMASSCKLPNVAPSSGMTMDNWSPQPMTMDNWSPQQMNMDNWSPQPMHYIEDNADVSQAPSFRNYTDYSIEYSPEGTEETANSISVENYGDSSGKVTASSRTFTLPPATTPTSALELSNITPPTLPSGCVPRGKRGVSVAKSSDLSNISQPELASGCIRRQPRSNDLSNVSPPMLASGCRRKVPCPYQGTYSRSRSDLSNVSPPALASGCVRQSPCRQFRNVSPTQLSCDPTQSSFDIANISSPPELPPTPRCPLLSAQRAKTPMRVKPNRPYRPRRICDEE